MEVLELSRLICSIELTVLLLFITAQRVQNQHMLGKDNFQNYDQILKLNLILGSYNIIGLGYLISIRIVPVTSLVQLVLLCVYLHESQIRLRICKFSVKRIIVAQKRRTHVHARMHRYS